MESYLSERDLSFINACIERGEMGAWIWSSLIIQLQTQLVQILCTET
jgi:hypothetical protein